MLERIFDDSQSSFRVTPLEVELQNSKDEKSEVSATSLTSLFLRESSVVV